jgi:hypothetical protein
MVQEENLCIPVYGHDFIQAPVPLNQRIQGCLIQPGFEYGKFRPDLEWEALEKLVAKNAFKLRHAIIWDKRGGRDILVRKCKNYNDGWLVSEPVEFLPP